MKHLKNCILRTMAGSLLLSSFIACDEKEEIAAPIVNPSVDFSFVVRDFEVSFNSASTGTDAYSWDFGDGSTSMEENPVHTYAEIGDYAVTLTAPGAEKSTSATATKTVSVGRINPTAEFTYAVNELTVSFTGTTTDAVSVVWDFGDGNTSTDENPTYTYSAAGDYLVSFMVEGVEGTTDAVVTQMITLTEPTAYKIEGTIIGHPGSWDSVNGLVETVFDGDLNTFVDAPGEYASTGFVGYDFGEDYAATLTSIKYAPRPGIESRVTGGEIRGSNDPTFAEYDVLYTISETPAAGLLTEAEVSATSSYRYIYYHTPADGYCNIAELEFYGEVKSAAKLAGTIIGHPGSWDGVNGLVETAFDGDLNTFVDAPGEYSSTGFVGYDFGEGYTAILTSIKYAPRPGNESRVVGAEIRGSNDPTFADYDVLYTISETPPANELNEASVFATKAYRYIYYYTSPDGYCNVAELEFYGF